MCACLCACQCVRARVFCIFKCLLHFPPSARISQGEPKTNDHKQPPVIPLSYNPPICPPLPQSRHGHQLGLTELRIGSLIHSFSITPRVVSPLSLGPTHPVSLRLSRTIFANSLTDTERVVGGRGGVGMAARASASSWVGVRVTGLAVFLHLGLWAPWTGQMESSMVERWRSYSGSVIMPSSKRILHAASLCFTAAASTSPAPKEEPATG